jgi:hypothetical protein
MGGGAGGSGLSGEADLTRIRGGGQTRLLRWDRRVWLRIGLAVLPFVALVVIAVVVA